MLIRHIGLKQFKDEAKSQEVQDAAIIKSYSCDSIKAVDDSKLVFDFTISTGSPDRDNDIIDADGWDLGAYKNNPVVLWAHSHDDLPIAKSSTITIKDAKLVATADFADASKINEFSATVAKMISAGLLNAASVGFRPLKYCTNEERGDWAYDFLEQELLEWSVVPVPANSEALAGAKSAGIDISSLKSWAEKTLDACVGSGVWAPSSAISKDDVEKAWSAAAGSPKSVAATSKSDTQSEEKGRSLTSDDESALMVAVESLRAGADAIASLIDNAEQTPDDDDSGDDDTGTGDESASDDASSDVDASADDAKSKSAASNQQVRDAMKELLPSIIREVTIEATDSALSKLTGRID